MKHCTFFIVKIPSRTELQQIAINCSSDTDFKGFLNVKKIYTAEPIITKNFSATLIEKL